MRVSGVNLKWLKPLLVVLSIIVGLVLFIMSNYGCVSNTTTPQSQPPILVAEEKTDSLKPFEQRFRKNLAIGDSVTFYNNLEIKISKSIEEEYNYVENGIIFSVDSNKIAKFIPKLTACKLLDTKYKQGTKIIDVIIVSSTKNGVEYILNYFRRGSLSPETIIVNGQKRKVIIEDPDTFILGGNAILKYKNQRYKIDVTSDTRCYLFVDYRKIIAPEDPSEEGWTK